MEPERVTVTGVPLVPPVGLIDRVGGCDWTVEVVVVVVVTVEDVLDVVEVVVRVVVVVAVVVVVEAVVVDVDEVAEVVAEVLVALVVVTLVVTPVVVVELVVREAVVDDVGEMVTYTVEMASTVEVTAGKVMVLTTDRVDVRVLPDTGEPIRKYPLPTPIRRAMIPREAPFA